MAKLTLLVVASRYDIMAKNLVARWTNHDAKLLTCEDLSMIGWRQYDDGKTSTAVVNGKIIPVTEISGVLVRLPSVSEQELIHIVPDDRSYVAAEMTAFLLYWLSVLKCPVLNRPTPTCLYGPNWRQEQWVHAAAKVGMPVHSISHLARFQGVLLPPRQLVTVTVVGDSCFGQVDDKLSNQVHSLAKMAGTDLLSVGFSDSEAGLIFESAQLVTENVNDDVADAILEYLTGNYM